PGAEHAQWGDWAKPISYQPQSGGVFYDEWLPLLSGFLRDLDPDLVIELVKSVLGLKEARWADLLSTCLDPDTYVYGQCAETVAEVGDRARVYMGIGVDAPRNRPEQA